MGLWDSLFGGKQLQYEKHKAILDGPADDISRLREFDRQVGKLTAAYNGVSRVPEAVTRQINALAKQVEPSVSRLVAKRPYEESALERAAGWARGDKPVTEVATDRLEYVITYPASYGKPIEQRLAQFKVGK